MSFNLRGEGDDERAANESKGKWVYGSGGSLLNHDHTVTVWKISHYLYKQSIISHYGDRGGGLMSQIYGLLPQKAEDTVSLRLSNIITTILGANEVPA